jgi:hypothetical protein
VFGDGGEGDVAAFGGPGESGRDVVAAVGEGGQLLVGQQDAGVLGLRAQAVGDDGFHMEESKGAVPSGFHIGGRVTPVTCAAPTSSRKPRVPCSGECLR